MRLSIRALFVFCIALLMSVPLSAQDHKWYKESTAPGTILLGAGPTFVGLNAQAGVFLKHNILVGVNGETHDFFTRRREAGVFAKKYLNKDQLTFYLQGGVTYGTFEEVNWNIDGLRDELGNKREPLSYQDFKLNMTAGGELRFSKLFSISGEFGTGKIMNSTWWAPSVRSSLNFRIK